MAAGCGPNPVRREAPLSISLCRRSTAEIPALTSKGTIHVVDDDDAMRESLIWLLEDAGYRAYGHASTEVFLASTVPSEPACIVSDLRMPGLDGLALLRRLRAEGSNLPLVIITGHGDIPLAVAAMKSGAVDFLEKPFEAEALIAAIESGLQAARRMEPAADEGEAALKCLGGLTAREREVFIHLVEGDSNKTIAWRLGVSPRTVEFHRAHIMKKAGARGLPDLVRIWLAARA